MRERTAIALRQHEANGKATCGLSFTAQTFECVAGRAWTKSRGRGQMIVAQVSRERAPSWHRSWAPRTPSGLLL